LNLNPTQIILALITLISGYLSLKASQRAEKTNREAEAKNTHAAAELKKAEALVQEQQAQKTDAEADSIAVATLQKAIEFLDKRAKELQETFDAEHTRALKVEAEATKQIREQSEQIVALQELRASDKRQLDAMRDRLIEYQEEVKILNELAQRLTAQLKESDEKIAALKAQREADLVVIGDLTRRLEETIAERAERGLEIEALKQRNNVLEEQVKVLSLELKEKGKQIEKLKRGA